MTKIRKRRKICNFLPGLLILTFGMLGIYATSTLSGEYQILQSEYFSYVVEKASHSRDANHNEILLARQMDRVDYGTVFAYWCVIALGLCGFLLLILNADKLNKLEAVNKEKQENLRMMENRLAAMEATLDGIILVGQDDKIYYLNNAMMSMFNIRDFDREDYIGREWIALLPENLRMEVEEEAFLALKQDGRWAMPIELDVPDEAAKQGRSRKQVEFTLINTPDGGKIGTARDVSHKLAADNERKEMQSQLYQAQKMEAVGRLAGGIAHDFNNILAAMNGYAEFLIEDLDPDTPQSKFAENILKAGHQARALVDQMLTFSRHRGSEFTMMDIMGPVNECMSMLRASLPKTIEVIHDFELPAPAIEGNETQISQVLMNLCVNAKDAMEDERGTLIVNLKRYDFEDIRKKMDFGSESILSQLPDPQAVPLVRIRDTTEGSAELLLGALAAGQEYVCLSVEDTGTGMSRSIMEFIFEPFFTTKPVNKGTGLGLSTAHGVIAAHRGALYLTSTVGKGTRFELYFPVADKIALKMAEKEKREENFVPANILLVEDQPEVMDITRKMLERLGYEVIAAESAIQALEHIRSDERVFDLVITDQNMPKMTGLELICEVNLDYPDLPFILLSGYSEQKLQDIMKENPAIKAILRKPVKKQALGEKIAFVLSEKKAV